MKGQAAMEYLMTYGWAILIVIAVVAALYAMGVFRVGGGTVPCSPCFSYFAFVDYSSTTGDLVIRNGPRTIQITNTSIKCDTDKDGTIGPNEYVTTVDIDGAPTTLSSTPTTINPGSTLKFTCYPGSVSVKYTDKTSGIEHTDSATLH